MMSPAIKYCLLSEYTSAKSVCSSMQRHLTAHQFLQVPMDNGLICVVRKSDFCICENKDADQLVVTARLISTFVFATRIERSLYFLNMEFQASGHLLWLYSPVCVGPGRKSRRPVFSERGSYGNSACQNFDNYSPIMCYQNTIKVIV